MDAADQIAQEGRVVGHPGQKLKDPPGPGDLSPDAAQAAIAKNRAAFTGFAAAFKATAGEFIAAIDKKNVDAYSEVGGKLDEVCESCHKVFWYPDSPKVPQ